MPESPTRVAFVIACVIALAAAAAAQQGRGWQRPPEPIASLVEAAPSPSVVLSPDRSMLLLVQREAMPGLDVVARTHLKLAGMRVDAPTRGPQLGTEVIALTLRRLADGSDRPLALPRGQIDAPVWSADGATIAFTRAADGGRELWLCDTATAAVKKVPGIVLTAVLDEPVQWLPDQHTLLLHLVAPGNGTPSNPVPAGPNVLQTAGKTAQLRTWQDLLQSQEDERLFEFYGRSQLARLDVGSLQLTEFGGPALYTRVDASPDGQYLLVEFEHRPFSFLVPHRQFPATTMVWTRDGKPVRLVHEHGLTDTVPIGGVPAGPRAIHWLPVHGHVLGYTEALDGGDPHQQVPHRDQVMVLPDLAGVPQRWLQTEARTQSIQYGEDGRLALLTEYDRDHRRQRLFAFDAAAFQQPGRQLHERSVQDVYGDPGQPVRVRTETGQSLLRMRGSTLFLAGRGASKDGEQPFLDAFDVTSGDKQRLFQSQPGRYETFEAFLDDDGDSFLIASESPTEPRNFLRLDRKTGARTALTKFTDATQQVLQQVHKQLLHYQRADGTQLSGTLYLPPGAREGDKLPCLCWAYPQEFNQQSDAGQVRGSPNHYARLAGTSPLWMLLAGYAVLDNAAMPIVGPVRTANDTFVQQLCANAEATVQALGATGRIDTARLAIGGHSYGAFMTANLLAHSDLFRAGIARSGAYNRTLTPFGFQNEERTFWQAPQVYLAMSPFAHAPDIDEPLLLIHGEDDDNPGTFPLQSQRLFMAIGGHGGTARLCMLPNESHGYRARESVQQCLFEMVDWLDRHVKPAPAARDGK